MLLLISSLLVFVTLAGLTRAVWWFSILDFFRLQYAVAGAIVLGFAVFYQDYLSVALALFVIGLNLYRIRYFLPRMRGGSGTLQKRPVLSVNAHKHNHDPAILKNIIVRAEPDLLLIMEMTEELEREIKIATDRYSHRLQTPVRDGFSICLLSKAPLNKTRITHHGPSDTPLLQAETMIERKKYQVFSAHPKPALNKEWYAERQKYYHGITEIISKAELPVVMMGDFNAVPWEDHFVKFLDTAGLKSTVEGHGYAVTWPVYFPLLGIPMDHILVSREEHYSELNVGPYVGSDHYPISISLNK